MNKETDQLNKKFSLIVTIMVMIFMFFTLPKLQGQNQQRIQKLTSKTKVDIFEKLEIKSITVIADVDWANAIPAMNRHLVRSKIKTLSESVVRQRLITITTEDNKVHVDGATKNFKSDLVLKISYTPVLMLGGYWAGKFWNVEIIDLSKQGQIVGTAYLKSMGRGPDAGPALINKIISKLK